MRNLIRHLVSISADTLPIPEPIYEFGSLQVEGSGAEIDLRPLFAGKQYVGTDMREGPGVDLVLDLHQIDLPDESVGTVLTIDTLEHVEYPRKALDELYRIIKPGGMILMTSVMNFPIHEHPYDYWRFTPEAFKSLLSKFPESYVDFAGDPQFPHTVFGIGFKGPSSINDEFRRQIEVWKQQWYHQEGMSWKVIRRQFTPPICKGWQLKKLLRRRKHK